MSLTLAGCWIRFRGTARARQAPTPSARREFGRAGRSRRGRPRRRSRPACARAEASYPANGPVRGRACPTGRGKLVKAGNPRRQRLARLIIRKRLVGDAADRGEAAELDEAAPGLGRPACRASARRGRRASRACRPGSARPFPWPCRHSRPCRRHWLPEFWPAPVQARRKAPRQSGRRPAWSPRSRSPPHRSPPPCRARWRRRRGRCGVATGAKRVAGEQIQELLCVKHGVSPCMGFRVCDCSDLLRSAVFRRGHERRSRKLRQIRP